MAAERPTLRRIAYLRTSGANRNSGPSSYRSGVKQIAAGRMGQIVSKYSENAPTATVCCNACRTCVTTNTVAILGMAIAGAGSGIWRVVRRHPR